MSTTARANEFVPARALESVTDRLLERTRLDEGKQLLRCSIGVWQDGRPTGPPICVSESPSTGADALIGSLGKALDGRSFSPARYKNRRVYVWVNFSVRFGYDLLNAPVQLVMYHIPTQLETLPDYTAPQRVVRTGLRWPLSCRNSYLNWFTVKVAATSHAAEVTPIKAVHEYCDRRFTRELKRSRYIPAFLNGVPVTANYDEVFYARNSVRTVTENDRN